LKTLFKNRKVFHLKRKFCTWNQLFFQKLRTCQHWEKPPPILSSFPTHKGEVGEWSCLTFILDSYWPGTGKEPLWEIPFRLGKTSVNSSRNPNWHGWGQRFFLWRIFATWRQNKKGWRILQRKFWELKNKFAIFWGKKARSRHI